MAIADIGNVAPANSKTTGTTLTANPTATLEAGNWGVLMFVMDNVQTTVGFSNDVTSVEDSGGNTWTKIAEFTHSNGAAGDGSTGALFITKATSDVVLTTGTITVNHSSCDARALRVHEFSGGTPAIAASAIIKNIGTLTVAHLALNNLTSREYLFFRMHTHQGTVTNFTNTAGWTGITATGTTGGTGGSNVSFDAEFIITTATQAVSGPTYAGTNAVGILAAIYEDSGGGGGGTMVSGFVG